MKDLKKQLELNLDNLRKIYNNITSLEDRLRCGRKSTLYYMILDDIEEADTVDIIRYNKFKKIVMEKENGYKYLIEKYGCNG